MSATSGSFPNHISSQPNSALDREYIPCHWVFSSMFGRRLTFPLILSVKARLQLVIWYIQELCCFHQIGLKLKFDGVLSLLVSGLEDECLIAFLFIPCHGNIDTPSICVVIFGCHCIYVCIWRSNFSLQILTFSVFISSEFSLQATKHADLLDFFLTLLLIFFKLNTF